jgi:hypothetical protein
VEEESTPGSIKDATLAEANVQSNANHELEDIEVRKA